MSQLVLEPVGDAVENFLPELGNAPVVETVGEYKSLDSSLTVAC